MEISNHCPAFDVAAVCSGFLYGLNTANALGIPTRYVQNEAHAFVEVWFPMRKWQRIDLGGSALRMNVSGADNKTLHRPRSDDPFQKPPEYKFAPQAAAGLPSHSQRLIQVSAHSIHGGGTSPAVFFFSFWDVLALRRFS